MQLSETNRQAELSMKNSSEMQLSEHTATLRRSGRVMQLSEHTATLRRSGRVRRSVVTTTNGSVSSDIEEEVPRKHSIKRCSRKKQKCSAVEQQKQLHEPTLVTDGHGMHKSLEVVHEQQEPHLAPSDHKMHKSLEVEHEQQELPLVPCGHEIPHKETRVEVPVVELPPSPEEEKPKFNLLFLLEHAVKPNSREEISPEDSQHLVNAASVLKSQLVARLTSSADNLKTEDMIDLANRCFRALRELGDDYRSFNKDVHKFISQQQELEFAAKEKENRYDWDLRARYSHQEQLMSDVTEKLFSAQHKLSKTTSHIDHLKLKKDELTSALLTVTEELSNEEQKIEALTGERDKFKEVYFDVEVGLQRLDAEKKESCEAFEAITAHFNAAKEELHRLSNYLLQLVRRPHSNQAAEPSTTSFCTADMAALISTGLTSDLSHHPVSPRPVCIGVSIENQAYRPAIGISSETSSPSAEQSWFYDPSLNMFL